MRLVSLRFTSLLIGRPVCLLSNCKISSTEWNNSSAWRGVILTSPSGGSPCGGAGLVGSWADGAALRLHSLVLRSMVLRILRAHGQQRDRHRQYNREKATAESPGAALQLYSLRLSLYVPYTFRMMRYEPVNLWSSTDHVQDYLGRADQISRRTEGETALLEFIPRETRRILDLGTGDGRLLALVRRVIIPTPKPSPSIFLRQCWRRSRKRFAGDSRVRVVEHNMDASLPALGKFDAVISSFAIHHLVHERKRALYAEIFAC